MSHTDVSLPPRISCANLPWAGLVLSFGALAAIGAVFLPHKQMLAVVAYAAAAAFGRAVAAIKAQRLLVTGVLVVSVVVPRVVQRPFPEPAVLTHATPYVGFLIASTIGAALATAAGRDRAYVVAPAMLVGIGCLVGPRNLEDPSVAWLAATGALYYLGRSLGTQLGVPVAIALSIGLASILFHIPGYQAGIASLPGGTRIFGSFGNPLVAADSILLLLCALCAVYWRSAVVILLFVGLTVAASWLTGSRTGILLSAILLLGVLLGFLPHGRAVKRARVIALLAAAGFCYVAFRGLPQVGRAGSLRADEDSWVLRVAGLREGMLGAVKHPTGSDLLEVTSSAGVGSTYENLFMDVGARLGWLPLLATIIAFIAMWRRSNSAGRVTWIVAVAAGFTAATYYFPSVYAVGAVCIGVASADMSATRATNAERLPSHEPGWRR